jgi:hypothetical protein
MRLSVKKFVDNKPDTKIMKSPLLIRCSFQSFITSCSINTRISYLVSCVYNGIYEYDRCKLKMSYWFPLNKKCLIMIGLIQKNEFIDELNLFL